MDDGLITSYVCFPIAKNSLVQLSQSVQKVH